MAVTLSDVLRLEGSETGLYHGLRYADGYNNETIERMRESLKKKENEGVDIWQ